MPPRPSGFTIESAPPHRTTSAAPRSTSEAACATASAPAAHAEALTTARPAQPEQRADRARREVDGRAEAHVRQRGGGLGVPRDARRLAAGQRRPPAGEDRAEVLEERLLEAERDDERARRARRRSQPARRHASAAATSAERDLAIAERAAVLEVGGEAGAELGLVGGDVRSSDGSCGASHAASMRGTGTSPATRVGNVDASKLAIGPMPLRPSASAPNSVPSPTPNAETTPTPVMTARSGRRPCSSRHLR